MTSQLNPSDFTKSEFETFRERLGTALEIRLDYAIKKKGKLRDVLAMSFFNAPNGYQQIHQLFKPEPEAEPSSFIKEFKRKIQTLEDQMETFEEDVPLPFSFDERLEHAKILYEDLVEVDQDLDKQTPQQRNEAEALHDELVEDALNDRAAYNRLAQEIRAIEMRIEELEDELDLGSLALIDDLKRQLYRKQYDLHLLDAALEHHSAGVESRPDTTEKLEELCDQLDSEIDQLNRDLTKLRAG